MNVTLPFDWMATRNSELFDADRHPSSSFEFSSYDSFLLALDGRSSSSSSSGDVGGNSGNIDDNVSFANLHVYNGTESVDIRYTSDDDYWTSVMSYGNQSSSTVYGTGELFHVSVSLVALLSVLYGLIAVAAVVGNALVIAAVVRNRSMQTVTNFFIANLSVADELIGIFSIPFQFQAALLQRWNLPTFLCPLAPFVKELSVTVSVGALVVISVDRYLAILRPLQPRISGRSATGVMAAVWAIAFVSALPSAVVFRVIDHPVDDDDLPETEIDVPYDRPTKPLCAPNFPLIGSADSGAIYRLVLAVVQYFLPLGVITFSYARIMHHVWLNKAPGSAVDTRDRVINRNKKKASDR